MDHFHQNKKFYSYKKNLFIKYIVKSRLIDFKYTEKIFPTRDMSIHFFNIAKFTPILSFCVFILLLAAPLFWKIDTFRQSVRQCH